MTSPLSTRFLDYVDLHVCANRYREHDLSMELCQSSGRTAMGAWH